jgi:hypothetical protein
MPLLQGATALVALLFFAAVLSNTFVARTGTLSAPQPIAVMEESEDSAQEAKEIAVEEGPVKAEEALPAAPPTSLPDSVVASTQIAPAMTVAERGSTEPAPQAVVEAPREATVNTEAGVDAVEAPAAETELEAASTEGEAPGSEEPVPDAPQAEEVGAAPPGVDSEPAPVLAPDATDGAPVPTAEPAMVAGAEGEAWQAESEGEPEATGALSEPLTDWLGTLEIALGLAFLVLAIITIVFSVRRLRAG